MSGNGRKTAALAALIAGRSIIDAAAQSGVSERSLRRWLKDPAFRLQLERAQAEVVAQTCSRLATIALAATGVLMKAMADPTASASARVQAARTALEMALSYREAVELETRLAAIEQSAEREQTKL